MDEGWTLTELVGRVAEALAAGEVRAPNARITELPDARVIRWYATIGLVDRPLGFRGRTALYGQRHLLQLVAVKRLQARGRTLAQIQFELAGATDETLRRVAVPPPGADPTTTPTPSRPSTAPTPGVAPSPSNGAGVRFWAAPSAPAPATPTARVPTAEVSTAEVPQSELPHEPAVYGLTLGGGALLLVPSAAAGRHVDAIRAAARPLLDLLAANGLLNRNNDDEGAPA